MQVTHQAFKQNYFKSALAFFFLFFLHGTSIANGQQGISYNVLQLGEVPPCRMFDLSTKVYGGILPNCCYKLVRYYRTELDLKDETFFFSFLCGGKNKNLKTK